MDVTKEEALQYEKDALLAHIEKRKANIKLFEDTIQKERDGIDRDKEMIRLIELHR